MKNETHLRHQDRLAMIGLMAGGIAHEMNNPLAGILLFAQVLLKELSHSDPVRKDIYEIEQAAQRCKTLVERVLEFSRPSGKEERTPLLLTHRALDQALGWVRMFPGHHQVELEREAGPEEGCHIPIDMGDLVQLFLNLLQNAYYAMSIKEGMGLMQVRHTHIPRGTASTDIWGVWEFEDTGGGVPPEQVSHMFQPFFTTKPSGVGTGLGLSLCQGLCHRLGGRLEWENHPGDGALFRVVLPACL